MRTKVEQAIRQNVSEYQNNAKVSELWRAPLVRFVDASHPTIPTLRDFVYPTHCLPTDLLDHPTVIISYFLPFSEEAVNSNRGGYYASEPWIQVYTHSENAIVAIDRGLTQTINSWGYHAVSPSDTGYVNEHTYLSRWSHRHIAYLGGMGTFGIHNLLITDSGCCGYYSSVITNLPIEPDTMLAEERCLYKKNGGCGLCIKHCIAGALTVDGFDRNICHAMCMENAEHYADTKFVNMADGCGKCAVGAPCSLRNPLER